MTPDQIAAALTDEVLEQAIKAYDAALRDLPIDSPAVDDDDQLRAVGGTAMRDVLVAALSRAGQGEAPVGTGASSDTRSEYVEKLRASTRYLADRAGAAECLPSAGYAAPPAGSGPSEALAITPADVIAEVVSEHGEECFISPGYGAHDDLVEGMQRMLASKAPAPPAAPPLGTLDRLDNITRVEVITEHGRAFTRWHTTVEASLQDNGRTLKLFLTPHYADPAAPRPETE